jgi:beta-carotene ketolase (CrtW type)
MKKPSSLGVLVAALVIGLWFTSTLLLFRLHIVWTSPLIYLLIFVQMHLYTGLFITAHDAMHGTISSSRKLNAAIGYLATFCYAAFWYPKLFVNHHKHHNHVHTGADPDYHDGTFLSWYVQFIRNYISWWQIVIMGAIFMTLLIWVPYYNLLLFWVIPSLLSTLQMFYFGTYLPHKGEHDNPYQSRTQSRNHIAAFFSCYFFGYHYEHHHSPGTPWWLLWKSPPPPPQSNLVKKEAVR